MAAYTEFSDQELTHLLSEGDSAAYTEIYNRYHAALYLHVYKRLRERETAKDIVHELFAVLWLKRDKIALTTSLAAYLYTSVRNRVLDFIAHNHVESEYIRSFVHFADSMEPVLTDHLVREKELLALVEKEIGLLPPKMRQVFELSRKGNLSHREIAVQLDISEQTVRKQVNNSLKILRLKLGSLFILAFM